MTADPIALPTRRVHIFDPPPGLAAARDRDPICPVELPDGVRGWLVTGHAETRAVLGDQRFSARPELRRMPPGVAPPAPAVPGFLVRMDAPDHPRYRRLLASHFSRRRLRELVPVITAITERHLEAIEAGGSPADLVSAFGLPIPALVVGHILGVPDGDLDHFQAASRTAVDLAADPTEVAQALAAINDLIADLVSTRRRTPGPDLLSELLAAGLSPAEVAAMGFLLLVAGHETTANTATLAVFALLCHSRALAAFRAALAAEPAPDPDDPGAPGPVLRAIDELLRYATINQFGALRVPLVEVELGGHRLQPGDPVVVSLPGANRDPRCYPEPDRLMLDRGAIGHLAFGHGAHLCTGHQLARLELRVMLGGLFQRFGGIRLAVAPQQVPLRTQSSVYGVTTLPVHW